MTCAADELHSLQDNFSTGLAIFGRRVLYATFSCGLSLTAFVLTAIHMALLMGGSSVVGT